MVSHRVLTSSFRGMVLMSTLIRSRLRVSGLLGALLVLLACESESLRPKVIDGDRIYWDLALNHRAVLLSTAISYNTLQLVATPRNALGEPLPDAPAAHYVSTDYDRVSVTPDGLVHALEPTVGPIWVRSTLRIGNLVHSDSVLVQVVDEESPQVLASLSIQPVPPDTAKTGVALAQSGTVITTHSLRLGFPAIVADLSERALDINGAPFLSLPV